MLVYRIGRTKFSNDLAGEGSRLHGGRWNHKLTPCIYTSESRALALLEYTVNVNMDDIPRALSLTTFDIPDKNTLQLKEADLPGNWKEMPSPSSTKDFGTDILKALKHPAFRIPSTVVPKEFNYILNPLHKDFGKFKITGIEDLVYDVRIKKV